MLWLQAFGMAPDATPNLQLDSRVENPHCFAVNYTGYLVVQNDSNIQFFGPRDNSLYNRFKVRQLAVSEVFVSVCKAISSKHVCLRCGVFSSIALQAFTYIKC